MYGQCRLQKTTRSKSKVMILNNNKNNDDIIVSNESYKSGIYINCQKYFEDFVANQSKIC